MFVFMQYLLSDSEGQPFRDVMKTQVLTLVSMATQQGQVRNKLLKNSSKIFSVIFNTF